MGSARKHRVFSVPSPLGKDIVFLRWASRPRHPHQEHPEEERLGREGLELRLDQCRSKSRRGPRSPDQRAPAPRAAGIQSPWRGVSVSS